MFCSGAIWELHDLAAKAWGHRANCLLLDSFLQDVMRTLDSQGSALAKADSLQLAHLLELIEAAIELVDGCNKSGWFFLWHLLCVSLCFQMYALYEGCISAYILLATLGHA